MKTKEAIEFIKALFLGDVKNDKDEDGILYSDRANDIIELLQRGEKFEAISQLIEETKIQPEINRDGKIIFVLKTNERNDKVFFSLRAVFRHLLCHTLKDLEQKYFPKPSDNFTEKVMEKINKEVDNETEIS